MDDLRVQRNGVLNCCQTIVLSDSGVWMFRPVEVLLSGVLQLHGAPTAVIQCHLNRAMIIQTTFRNQFPVFIIIILIIKVLSARHCFVNTRGGSPVLIKSAIKQANKICILNEIELLHLKV